MLFSLLLLFFFCFFLRAGAALTLTVTRLCRHCRAHTRVIFRFSPLLRLRRRYLVGKNIEFIFFSAKLITDALEAQQAELRRRELEQAEQEAVDALQKEMSKLQSAAAAAGGGGGGGSAAAAAAGGGGAADGEAAAAAEGDDDDVDTARLAAPATIAADAVGVVGNAFHALAEDEEEDDDDDEDGDGDGADDTDAGARGTTAGSEATVVAAAAAAEVEVVPQPDSSAATAAQEQDEKAEGDDQHERGEEGGGGEEAEEGEEGEGEEKTGGDEQEEEEGEEEEEEDEQPVPTAEQQAAHEAREARIREKTRILSRQQVLDLLESFHPCRQQSSPSPDDKEEAAPAGDGTKITVGACFAFALRRVDGGRAAQTAVLT